MNKLIILCATALTSLLLVASVAGCRQPPEPVAPGKGPISLAIMVESSTIEAGSSFVVSGSNFKPYQ